MRIKSLSLAAIAAGLATLSGCAAYRTDSNVTFDSTQVAPRADKIIISEDALPGRKYKTIAPVEGTVKKLTVFHDDPTKEQVNIVLKEKAREIGADAVVNVTYKSGIGFMTWGYLEGTGTGVKLSD